GIDRSNFTGYIEWVTLREWTDPEPTNSTDTEVLAFDINNSSINPTSSNSQTYTFLSGFSESATKNGGEIKYQISSNAGATWYWYNSGWTTTTSGYSEANTATEINSNISSLPDNSEFLFKAYLHSDGTQQPQLNSITLSYSLTSGTSTGTSVAAITSGCNDQSPGSKAPWLYAAIPQGKDSIMLYFTDADGPLDKYVLQYGLESGKYIYGAENIGGPRTRTYLVQELSPNTAYYFRVQGWQ
ncbi:unnamed protein product, partial [marine sediment metagenome]